MLIVTFTSPGITDDIVAIPCVLHRDVAGLLS
jgi:hypothetical protein